MAIINLPQVSRPAPLRPAPRTTNFSGEASLASAQAQTANAALNFGTALVELVAGKGQAEYNEGLVKYKTAEMEKMAELQAKPIESIDDKETGTSHDLISKQSAMKALPNTNAMRTWRREYLDNEILPSMKSNQAKKNLKLKIDADSIETDKKIIDFDYKQNKARLADSYTEKSNVYLAAGDRNEFRGTILEANKLGIYDSQEADDILDTGFALMHQNDVLNAAITSSFANKAYGDDSIGKKVIKENLTYESYDGTQKTLSESEVNKQFKQSFDDQRKAFTTKMDEYFAVAEDKAASMFIDGTLSNEWVEQTFTDIPGTDGKSKQRYWLNQVKSLKEGTSGNGSIEMKDVLDMIQNPFMDKSIKQKKLLEIATDNPGFTPEVLKTFSGFIEDSQKRIDPRVTSAINILDEAKKKAEAIYKKKPEEGAAMLSGLYELERSALTKISEIGNEKDVIKRDKQLNDLATGLIKYSSDLKALEAFAGTPAEVGNKAEIVERKHGYNIEYDRDLGKKKSNYNDAIAYTEEGQNVIKQITKYEGDLLSETIGVKETELVRGTDGKFSHVVPEGSIKAANKKVMNGKTVVRIDKDEKGNTVLQYLTNSKDENNNPVFQTYELKPNRGSLERDREAVKKTQDVYDTLYGSFK